MQVQELDAGCAVSWLPSHTLSLPLRPALAYDAGRVPGQRQE